MQPRGTTDDLEPGDQRGASESATTPLEVHSPQGGQPTLTHLPVSSGRDQCGACGALLAPDQRYCVECGQRRGPARVPFGEQLAQSAEAAPATSTSRRRTLPRFSANAALIAAIGTLMLAMGVGVLIGRAASSEKSSSTPIHVTIGGGTGTAATTTAPTTSGSSAATESTEATKSSNGGGSASKAKSESKSASKAAAKSTKPKAKVVKIGSKGSGAGYNKKKEFTGEFFGEEEK